MGDHFPRVRLAAIQAAPVWLDREATVAKACQLIREAGANGANFIGFPENFIPAHPVWYHFHPATSPRSIQFAVQLFKNSVEIPGPATDALCEAAREADAYVVIGMTEKLPNTTGTLYSTQLFIDRRGRIIGKHQKLVQTVGERLVLTGGSGDTMRTFPTEFGPVSGLICGENFNPLAVAVLAAEYTRIHVAAFPSNFAPTSGSVCESSLLASRNVAYMAKCFVISACSLNSAEMIAALPVTEADRKFLIDDGMTGGSVITNPRGEVIAGPLHGDREGILYADADLEATVRGRLVQDMGGHYNRQDVFQLHVRATPPSLLVRDGIPWPQGASAGADTGSDVSGTAAGGHAGGHRSSQEELPVPNATLTPSVADAGAATSSDPGSSVRIAETGSVGAWQHPRV